MKLIALIALLALTAAASADTWSRGDYGKLSFDADGRAYTWSFGDSAQVFSSYPGSLQNVTASSTSSGSDAVLGDFDEIELSLGDDGALAVRYFSSSDAFLFLRRPRTAALNRAGRTLALLPLPQPLVLLRWCWRWCCHRRQRSRPLLAP